MIGILKIWICKILLFYIYIYINTHMHASWLFGFCVWKFLLTMCLNFQHSYYIVLLSCSQYSRNRDVFMSVYFSSDNFLDWFLLLILYWTNSCHYIWSRYFLWGLKMECSKFQVKFQEEKKYLPSILIWLAIKCLFVNNCSYNSLN